MIGRDSNEDGLVSMHWQNPAGPDVLTEIRRTSTVRDVREAMLALAYAIEASARPASGLCIVLNSRLSMDRLDEELTRFRAIVKPGVAEHIHLAAATSGPVMAVKGSFPTQEPGFMAALHAAVQREMAPSAAGRFTRQQVKALLVERWLWGLPALSLADTRRQTGASYATVAAALDELRQLHLLGDEREGPIVIRDLRPPLLLKLADEHGSARKLVRFVDPTGLAKLPSAMATRLESLRGRGEAGQVAVGGVLGAVHHFEDLNITAAPRLDLSVFDGDMTFVRQLDAGLMEVPKGRTNTKVTLAVHLQRDCRPPELRKSDAAVAAYLDCLADLLEVGLQADAEEFAYALCEKARLSA